MDSLPRFKIALSPSTTEVSVDGKDVSNIVQAVQVTRATRYELPSVTIEVMADAVDLDVQGLVASNLSVAEFLEAVDADALARRALEGDGQPIHEALRILKEEARGQA